ncbi:hypothetical protein LBMAG27_19700 [Bacteroidota bacterium]|nr:hypothetical protein LBMAG27_19700 [Bacteroidota bacterium]
MKNKIIIIALLFSGFTSAFTNKSFASVIGGKEKAVIQTSAMCGECQEKIEGAVKILDGIKSVDLNLDNKKLTVVFNPTLISLAQIKTAISAVGYDADEVKANGEAYNNLPKCCKKDGHE